jgi:hypothetical protein
MSVIPLGSNAVGAPKYVGDEVSSNIKVKGEGGCMHALGSEIGLGRCLKVL